MYWRAPTSQKRKRFESASSVRGVSVEDHSGAHSQLPRMISFRSHCQSTLDSNLVAWYMPSVAKTTRCHSRRLVAHFGPVKLPATRHERDAVAHRLEPSSSSVKKRKKETRDKQNIILKHYFFRPTHIFISRLRVPYSYSLHLPPAPAAPARPCRATRSISPPAAALRLPLLSPKPDRLFLAFPPLNVSGSVKHPRSTPV